MKIELGDLVQLNKSWKNRIGFVLADDKSWWVISKHYDIANCICEAKDVKRIIKRKVLKTSQLKYAHY